MAAVERPLKLAIAALGGQGGGVLTEWLIHTAEAERWLVQSTSVPGVAQRTGATIYYLEFFPRDAAAGDGREPVFALMPAAGDVDCVIAAELAESARAIQRGIVTPDRTTLIASSHRVFTIAEKSALGSGAADTQALFELARTHARRLILFDAAALAEQHGSPVSATLLGAVAAAGVLPFAKETYLTAVRASGIAVERNLAAFEAAYERVLTDTPAAPGASLAARPPLRPVPEKARSSSSAPLLARIKARFPAHVQPLVLEGVRRLIDYQDPRYAALYLERLDAVLAVDAMPRDWQLTEVAARALALWMSFEDTIRIADLKTRGARFARVRAEVDPGRRHLVGITDFLAPRAEEIAGTLPARVGRGLLASRAGRRVLERATGGRRIRTSTISGYLFLRAIAALRPFRRGTLRFADEDARIVDWLRRLTALARINYPLAVEAARAQRLVKGYGETHARGLTSFSTLMSKLDELAGRADGAAVLAALHEAALADEHGVALGERLRAHGLGSTPPRPLAADV